jgi:hypothetical protein
MEPQTATTVNIKKLIHTPEQYDAPAYRQRIYDRWMAEVAAATAAFADINNSPHYGSGSGWRVD